MTETQTPYQTTDTIGERTREVFDYILRFKREHDGLAPSFREIMEFCQISSTSTVDYHLNKLHDAGLIDFYGDVGITRNIMVTDGEWRQG